MDLKYKQKRKLVEFTCDYCNSKNTKPESEFKRNIKLGRHNFCSRSCAIKYAQINKLTNLDNWRNSTINKQNLLNNCNNRKNEFTSFNYTLRNVKHRFKECNIQFTSTPINYLKNTMSDSETKQYLKSISKYISTFVEY